MTSKKQIFNGIFFFNLVAVVVIGIQAFTGFVVEPSVQVAILTVLNLLFRIFTGKKLYSDKITAPVLDFAEQPKLWYTSKTLWVSILTFGGAIVQSITGWQIPEEMYLEAVAGISFVLSVITHKPVKLM